MNLLGDTIQSKTLFYLIFPFPTLKCRRSHGSCICLFLFMLSLVSLFEQCFSPSMLQLSLEHHILSDFRCKLSHGHSKLNVLQTDWIISFPVHSVFSLRGLKSPAPQTLRIKNSMSSLALSPHPHVLDRCVSSVGWHQCSDLIATAVALAWFEPVPTGPSTGNKVSPATLVFQKLSVAF